jgi:hypothetical protein
MDAPTVLVSALVGAATSAVTAYFTSKLKVSEEREKWSRDFALKYAEALQTNPAVAASLAKQFAIALLIVHSTGMIRRKIFAPPSSRLVVGRGADNEIVVEDASVSTHHGAFYTDNVHIFVESMGATNGVFVNSKLVKDSVRVLLRNGDVVKMGETHFDVFLLS